MGFGTLTAVEDASLRGGGLGELRSYNRAAVLRALLDRGPLSRTELGRLVGLPPSVLSYISAELLEAGLVEVIGEPPRSGAGAAIAAGDKVPLLVRQRRGRQPIPLQIATFRRGALRCAVCVHIGATGTVIGLVDLRARQVASKTLRIDHASRRPSPQQLICEIVPLVEQVLAQHDVPHGEVVGVGVGVAGWVDAGRGVVRRLPQLGWTDVPLADLLSRALRLPVAVDDHVRAMAAAEAWFGEGRDAETLSFLYVGGVVGCSSAIGRRVHHGHHAAAGRVEFLPPRASTDGGPLEAATLWDGKRMTVEAAVSEQAMVEAAERLARRRPGSVLARWLSSSRGRRPTSASLATLAERTGDEETERLLRGRAAALAPLLAHVLGVFDPELLVVAGPIARDPGLYQLRLLHEEVVGYAPELRERMPAIKPSAFRSEAVVVSAGALVVREIYTPPLAGQATANGAHAINVDVRQRAFAARVPSACKSINRDVK